MSNIDLRALVEQMTLQEKADQLFQLSSIFYVKDKAEITGPINHFGLDDESISRVGTMLGGVGAEKAIQIQNEHMESDRNHIPMVFMRDIIHGCYTVFPIPLAMGCTFDPQLMEDCSYMSRRRARYRAHTSPSPLWWTTSAMPDGVELWRPAVRMPF